jgi:hypothetical protein
MNKVILRGAGNPPSGAGRHPSLLGWLDSLGR